MLNKIIEIWDKDSYKIESDGFRPTLTTYILESVKKRPVVLICPGGGYCRTSEREAEPIAVRFNAAGFHAVVLNYSVAPRKHPQPIMDVSRAMVIIRENAENWNMDSGKIAVCGFSAGGHLAASLGVYWDKSYLMKVTGMKAGLNKPNALILGYPVISSGPFAHRGSFDNLLGENCSVELLHEMSLEHHISENTPPTFLWHTFADQSVPLENSLMFADGLRENGIPFEFHVYPEGRHGLSLATEETDRGEHGVHPHIATWIDLCIEWLREQFK